MAKIKERRKGKQAPSRTVMREHAGSSRAETRLHQRDNELRDVTPRPRARVSRQTS